MLATRQTATSAKTGRPVLRMRGIAPLLAHPRLRTGCPVRGDVAGAAFAYLESHGVQGLLVTGGGDVRTTEASDFELVGSRTRNE